MATREVQTAAIGVKLIVEAEAQHLACPFTFNSPRVVDADKAGEVFGCLGSRCVAWNDVALRFDDGEVRRGVGICVRCTAPGVLEAIGWTIDDGLIPRTDQTADLTDVHPPAGNGGGR